VAGSGDIQPVDQDAPAYAWQQIVRQILGLVAAGTWPAGRRIPSEGDLGYGFQVARGTLRKATEWLAERGIIVTRRGRGTFIADPLPDPLPEPPA
jgi:GntR family transcriptional regulator